MKTTFPIIDKLNELVVVFSNLKTLKELAVEFEKNVDELFDMTNWGIYLFDFEEKRFRILCAEGFTAGKLKEIEQEAMSGFPGIVFRTAKMIYFPDMDQVDVSVPPTFQYDFKVRSRIYIPLMNNSECVGTFGAISTHVNFLSEEDIAVLTFICNLTGMAYGNLLNRHNLSLASTQIENREEKLKINQERTHKIQENELRSVYSYLSTLIRNLNVGILVENEDRKIVLMNQEFCNFFHIPVLPENLYGQDCCDYAEQMKHLFTEPEEFVSRITRLLGEKQPAFDEKLRMTDGRFFSRDYIPIFANDEFQGNLWQYRDITKQKEEEIQLSEARKLAEQANQAKSIFLANMSHEIRTPMNAIYGIIRLLDDYEQNESQQRLIKGLTTSAENLLTIINDILDFSKIEAGLLVIDPTTFNLKEQFLKIMHSLEFKANEKFIDLLLNYDEKISPYQFSDSTRLKQVFTNLVNNAIKFTEKGRVEMGCQLEQEDEEYNTIRFWVKDTGIGIDEKNLIRIFDSFQQEEAGTYRKSGGTGLGLSISRQIVDKLGGKIEVFSRKDEGSTFSFRLKLKKGDEREYLKTNAEFIIDPQKLAGKEILLVEDVPINQFVIRSIVEKWNIKVTTAMNGKDAIDLLKRQHFDLILMDKQMPVMNGIEATVYIRQQMKLDIPIIALTANIVKEVIDQCYNAGMNDYVSKPFEPYVLHEKIAGLLSIPIDKQFTAQKGSRQTGSAEKLYDLSKLGKMLDNDREKIDEMIGQIRFYIPPYLQELMDYYRSENMKGLAKSAHKFKSSLLLIGSAKVANLIKTIENYSSNNKNQDELKILVPRFEKIINELLEQLEEDFQK